MRIGFTGAQGTGKTTLINLLEEDGSLGPITRTISPARTALSLGLLVNRDADVFSQLMVSVANINKEYMVDPTADMIISDRTPVDSLAYTLYQLKEVWTEMDGRLSEWYWNQLLVLSLSNMDVYDELFYFPAYFAPKSDGVRDSDREYQLDIDLTIKRLLDENDIEVHIVPDVSKEERLTWIKGVLSDSYL